MTGRRGFDRFLADIAPFFYKRPVTYVDIGAYDGRVFEKVLRSPLQVHEAHLIEPNEKYLDRARSVGADLFRGRSVDYYPVAIGAESGRVRMHDSKSMTRVVNSDRSWREGPSGEQVFEVDCVTLDELAERFTEKRISILKVDVEGYEMEVLAGARNLLRDQRIDVLYIEAGMNPAGNQQVYYREIEDELARFGYRMFRIYEQKHEWLDDSPLLRRTNISFFSSNFADSNPYRVTRELYKTNRELEMLQKNIDLEASRTAELSKQLEEAQKRLAKAESELEQATVAAEELRSALESLRRSLEVQRGRLEDTEAEKRELEKRLHQAFDCISHLHGRQAYTSGQLAVAREDIARLQASFSYRLGRLLVHHGRSPLGWLKAPIAIARELVRHRRRLRSRTGYPAPEDSAPLVALTKDHARWLPVTQKPQLFDVSAPDDGMDLWATALTAHSGASVDISVQRLPNDTPPESTPEVDQLQRLRGLMIRRFTLEPGIPVRVLEGVRGDQRLKIVREEGRFCALKLRLAKPDTRREDLEPDESAESPEQHEQSTATALLAGPRPSSPGNESASPQMPVRQAREPVKHPGHGVDSEHEVLPWQFSAAKLGTKLWGGYARYAIPELERLRLSEDASLTERRAAAWQLTRWFYVEGEYERVLKYIEFVKQLGGKEQSYLALAEAQTLIALQRYREADVVLQRGIREHRALDFQLLRPRVARHLELERSGSLSRADKVQLDLLNELYVSVGLAPIRKKREEEPLHLSNITADARPKHAHQDLKVSVILPAYNAGDMLEWVIDSILEQTWRNLEVIVVDDCSTDDTCAVVERIARRDSRVQLVRLKENSGAYPARNAGLRHVSGDLVTVHDSDDWSHPERIELQVAALESNPSLVATMSHWVRVNEELEVVGGWITKGAMVDLNFSSLLFRREVLDILGAWDEVLVSADAEFYSRLKRVFGRESIFKLPRFKLLALSLTRDSSLTRSKATHLRTLYYGLRRNYRQAYRNWHDRLVGDYSELPFSAAKSPRPFPIPRGNRPSHYQQSSRYDLVVISDLAMPGGAFVSTLNYIVAARKAGKRTAVFHWPRIDLATDARPQPRLHTVCAELDVDILSPGDAVDADFVLFGYPVILQYRIDPLPVIRANQVVVVVNQFASRLVDGGDCQYDPGRIRSHLRDIFGMEGIWVPISNWVKRLIEEDGRYPIPHREPWYPMLDTESWCARPIRWGGAERSRPVVGRHGRDTYTKWPSDPEALAQAYGVRQDWDVRFLGGARYAIELLGEKPRNWTILPFDDVSAEEFLQDLDFYVHYPHERYIEEFGRGVMEAMAMGIPVILPPQFQETFGDAALYALPFEVPELISELWASGDKYLKRARAGRDFVLKNCSLSVFPARLAALPQPAPKITAERTDLSASAQ